MPSRSCWASRTESSRPATPPEPVADTTALELALAEPADLHRLLPLVRLDHEFEAVTMSDEQREAAGARFYASPNSAEYGSRTSTASRGRAIGRRLLEAAKSATATHSILALNLEVATHNDRQGPFIAAQVSSSATGITSRPVN